MTCSNREAGFDNTCLTIHQGGGGIEDSFPIEDIEGLLISKAKGLFRNLGVDLATFTCNSSNTQSN